MTIAPGRALQDSAGDEGLKKRPQRTAASLGKGDLLADEDSTRERGRCLPREFSSQARRER